MTEPNIKIMNDVTSLYEGKDIIEDENGEFDCPVCNKHFKSKTWAVKHFEKQDCYNMKDAFSGTEHESRAYVLYKSIISSVNSRARTTLKIFRNSRYYSPVMRFILFCSVHEVKDPGLYYSWLTDIRGMTNMNSALSKGIVESFLHEFRKFLLENDSLIENDVFYDRYKDDLIEDQHFFVRSVQKGHIGVNYLWKKKDFPFMEVAGKMDAYYYDTLDSIIEELNI